MTDISKTLHDAIGRHLDPSGFDLLDLVPIPTTGDPMVRIRTLEEMLAEQKGMGYLLRIRAKSVPPLDDSVDYSPERPQLEGIYLPNGKLNVGYLTRNADLLFEAGEYALARNIYRTILQGGEHTGPAQLRIGRCFEAEGKESEALAAYTEAVTYYPTLDGYRRIGALYERQGKLLGAAESYERGTQMREAPRDQRAELHRLAADAFARAQKSADAQRHYLKVLELQPQAAEVRTALGDLQLQAKQIADARRSYQDALASNPRSASALLGLGMIALQDGNTKGAHDFFAQSLEIDPLQQKAIFHLVKSAYELKSYAVAARILANYVDIAPVNANLLYSLAGLQFHMGRLDDAQRTIDRVLQISPTHSASLELQKLVQKLGQKNQ